MDILRRARRGGRRLDPLARRERHEQRARHLRRPGAPERPDTRLPREAAEVRRGGRESPPHSGLSGLAEKLLS